MMFQFSPHYNRPLREIEVFTGTILGKDGSLPSKTQRDEKKQMKTEFEEHVEYTVKHILHGTDDGNHSETEALARSVACLSVAMEESEAVPKIGKLESFRYIAATICLQEVQKFHNLPF